jgi:chemotaxis protein CheC
MDLTSSQQDALTELINIGYARAAAALSDLTGHRISLEVPEVAIHLISEIRAKLQNVIEGEVLSVNQVFSGPISGNAILLLDRKAALLLNTLLTDRSQAAELDGAAREVITEVGNIVLNTCLGAFGNLLKVQVTFTVPYLQVESVQKVLESITVGGSELEYALVIHTHFHVRTSNINGYLVIILGVTSLKTLLQELRKWEERELH